MMNKFENCEICGSPDWKISYKGKVRDGAFGSLSKDEGPVGECLKCGVERLHESACVKEDLYCSEEYRRLLNEPEDAAGFMAEHDVLQLRNLSVLWPESIRYKAVADIGCAAGSFLDHISGLAGSVVSVEPCEGYHDSLEKRGYNVYSCIGDAHAEWEGKIDYAFCFSVIEHVADPRSFLGEIKKLLKPEGKLIVSTPNRSDLLMDLMGDEYKKFFYRTVHRWYFDTDSFGYCANEAGLDVVETRFVHRFGLSNAVAWLRDGKPTGDVPVKHLDSPMLDDFWKGYLESRGVADYLYFKLANES